MVEIDTYAKLWSLSAFEKIDYNIAANSVYKCISAEYGSCVLKFGNSFNETQNQYNALIEYNGRHFCKVYKADINNEVLLLESIIPGTELRAVPELDKRLEIFCELFEKLHIKPQDKAIYPTYMDWVSRITEYIKNRNDYKDLCAKMIHAEEIFRLIWSEYNNEMLLHGDFHHDNILLGENNQYRIIDPKGVVGDKVFDIARFILNEFGDVSDSAYEKIDYIIRTVAKRLNINESVIRRLLYAEACMAHCWCVEDGIEPDMNVVMLAERLMRGIFYV